jgi:peptidoglycan/LPS O-acetylase OafA/YrhL
MGSFIYTASLKAKHLKIILISAAVLYLFFLLLKLPGFNPFFLFLIALSLFIYFAGFTKRILLVLRTDISYGLYIYAFPVQQILFGLSGYIVSPVYLLIETFAVTTLLALASWHLIEKPFIALKHGKATS